MVRAMDECALRRSKRCEARKSEIYDLNVETFEAGPLKATFLEESPSPYTAATVMVWGQMKMLQSVDINASTFVHGAS